CGHEPASPRLAQNLGREMQPRGGRGHRATLPRINRLISFPVALRIGPRNVRGQWNVSNSFNRGEYIRSWLETDPPFSEATASHHLGLKFVALSEEKTLPYHNLAPRTHQAFPFIRIVPNLPRK